MTSVTFSPSGPLRGAVTAPPDKSISHRAALLGAMSLEPVRISNYLRAQDTLSTLEAMRSAGQRALDSAAAAGKIQSFGLGRSRRWMTPPAPGFTTALLLPSPLPIG